MKLWKLTWWFKRQIKRLVQSPHVYKNEVDGIKSACAYEIFNRVRKPLAKIDQLVVKHGLADIKNDCSRVYRSGFDDRDIKTQPVFADNEVAGVGAKYLFYTILSIVLILPEVYFYYLTAVIVFGPSLPNAVKWGLGVITTIAFVFGWSLLLKKHDKYLKVRAQYKDEPKNPKTIQARRDFYTFAVIGVLIVAAMIFVGLARIYYFESTVQSNLSAEKIHNNFLASIYGTAVTIILTFVLTIGGAYIKAMAGKHGRTYTRYRAWKHSSIEMEQAILSIFQLANEIENIHRVLVEKYWMFVVDLKRVLWRREYDSKYDAANRQFLRAMAQPQFSVTEKIYSKYSFIQSAHYVLFYAGVTYMPGITSILESAAKSRELARKHFEKKREEIAYIPVNTTTSISTAKTDRQRAMDQVLTSQNNTHSNNLIPSTMKQVSIIILFVLGFSSCKPTSTLHGSNIVIPVDLSDSRDTSIFSFYRKSIENIYRQAHANETVRVIPIDRASYVCSEEIFVVDYASNVYYNENAGIEAEKLAEQAHHDSAQFNALKFGEAFDNALRLRRGYAAGTDIPGAFRQAVKYYLPSSKNVLVIFSDMIEDNGKDVDFAHGLNDENDIDTYLSKVDSIDLTGWQILVITGAQKNITPDKFKVVKKFWEAYFIKCHGTLLDYNSGLGSYIDKFLH